jgi:hemolysin activation/secretion protein
LSNHHSASTDALRLEASLRHDNLFQLGHSLALSLTTAPRATQQTRVATLGYTVPLGEASSVSMSLTHSNSAVEPLGNSVLGRGNTARLRYSQGWADARAAHTLSLGAEFRDLQQRVRAGTQVAAGAAAEVSTPLRYLPLQAAWDSQWWHGGGTQAAQTDLGVTLTVGLRSLLRRSVPCPPDDSLQDQFACNRDGADGGFATLRLDARHAHAMPAGLPGRLAWRMSGQLALQPLVSGEQFTIGGASSVRGYLESEASGDTGLVASLEWQGPNLARRVSASLGLGDNLLREVSGIGFIDAGLVRVIDPLPDQAARTGLAGAGLGLRLAGAAGSSADVLLAWPLRRSAQTAEGRLRVHARMALSF